MDFEFVDFAQISTISSSCLPKSSLIGVEPEMQKKVLLGVGGGIAAYKTPELARLLVQRGYEVQAVLTPTASQFVTSTALQAVTNRRVRSDLWDEEAERSMSHIELARWADIVLIAPATASLMSRLSNGFAPDLLTTLYLATTAPTIIVPAMNHRMWLHKATQRHLHQLQDDGVLVVGPDVGHQACGEFGPGRMSSPLDIADFVESQSSKPQPLRGKRVLVTAGPTREPIDPVRYISNSSSGRQGFALAEAAADAGAEVALISGPVHLETPRGLERIDITTAAEMKYEVMQRAEGIDVFFSVAAVADYRAAEPATSKIKRHLERNNGDLSLALAETDDIVKAVAQLEDGPYVVGFAAETNNVLEFGKEKRIRKKLDAIVINDVSDREIGFESTENAVTIVTESEDIALAKAPKSMIAQQIVDVIAKNLTDIGQEISTS